MTGDPRLDLTLSLAAVAAAWALLSVIARHRGQRGRDRHGLREAVGVLSRVAADLRADRREVLGLRADRERLAGQVAELRRANELLMRLAGITASAEPVEPDTVDVPTLTLVAPSTEDDSGDEAVSG